MVAYACKDDISLVIETSNETEPLTVALRLLHDVALYDKRLRGVAGYMMLFVAVSILLSLESLSNSALPAAKRYSDLGVNNTP